MHIPNPRELHRTLVCDIQHSVTALFTKNNRRANAVIHIQTHILGFFYCFFFFTTKATFKTPLLVEPTGKMSKDVNLVLFRAYRSFSAVQLSADSFHAGAMVLICETKCSRSANGYMTVEGETVCVCVRALSYPLLEGGQGRSHPGDTPVELHTSLNKMRKHLEQNYETISNQAPLGKYIQDSRASARRQTSTPHASQWLSSVKNRWRCLCARRVFSVTKAGQTDSNAKNPEWLTLALRLCLHSGKWVVCSGSLMALGHPPWMNVERRLLRNDPRQY